MSRRGCPDCTSASMTLRAGCESHPSTLRARSAAPRRGTGANESRRGRRRGNSSARKRAVPCWTRLLKARCACISASYFRRHPMELVRRKLCEGEKGGKLTQRRSRVDESSDA
eukprot:6181401-Pleurochrysis_carterae.AAC.1